MKTILHISHEDHSADILASDVRAITRMPADVSVTGVTNPARTRVDYGHGCITLPISIEEHYTLVSAWRAST